tara:strand:- start:870 stop:1640 length:771 start_codon:yes stop_codon:yes gene_type:complete
MGVYNAEATIEACIDSVLAQSFHDFEFVICDDGSVDNSLKIIEAYRNMDDRVIVLSNKINMGLAFSLNRCIDESVSDFLIRQDADDISKRERFYKQFYFIKSHLDVSVVGTAVELIESGKVWGKISWPEQPRLRGWIHGPQVVHPSCIMRRMDIIEVGKYDVNALRVEDLDLWYRLLAANKKIINMSEELYQFTWGRQDYSRKKFKDRLVESVYRYRGYRKLRAPLWSYFYVAKPLLLGLVPRCFIFIFHKRRFAQ